MWNRHFFNISALRDMFQHLQLVHIAGKVQAKPRDIIMGPLSHQTGNLTHIDNIVLVNNSALQIILHSGYELPLAKHNPRPVYSSNISNADFPGKLSPIFRRDRRAL